MNNKSKPKARRMEENDKIWVKIKKKEKKIESMKPKAGY